MAFTFEKVADLKYDALVTLYLIETDELLNGLFVENVKTPFNLLYKFIKDGSELLSTETKEYIFELFENVISTRKNLAERYQHLQSTDYVNQVLVKKGIDEVVEPSEKVIIKTESYKVKHDKPAQKALPRLDAESLRYHR